MILSIIVAVGLIVLTALGDVSANVTVPILATLAGVHVGANLPPTSPGGSLPPPATGGPPFTAKP